MEPAGRRVVLVEFIDEKEISGVLQDYGITQVPLGDECVELRMVDDPATVRVHLACDGCGVDPHDGAETVAVDRERLSQIVEHILHILHLNQVLLIPCGKWRNVFDAVAFSLAANESWQEVDAAATVELNQRDPLLCTPADYPTIQELLTAVFTDAETPAQGLAIVSPSAPILIEIVPEGALRISIGNQVLADEVADAFAVS